ncbi:MAG: 4'-phosphopantetheinyl transferase family protein [Lachnospiraceae bacterium]
MIEKIINHNIHIIVSELFEPDESVIRYFDTNRQERIRKKKSVEQKREIYTSGVLINKIKPDGADISYIKNGKPCFVSADNHKNFRKQSDISVIPPYFSVTHSAHVVILVWTDDMEIGADFESYDRKISPSIVRRLCTDTEKEYYSKFKSQDEANAGLIELYTKKEAVSKLLGEGLRMDFTKIDLSQFVILTEKIEGGCLSIATK